MMECPERTDVLRRCGATQAESEELIAYIGDGFDVASASSHSYPLPNEPFVEAWRGYVDEARDVGAAATLRRHLVQLHFPVRQGLSETEPYRQATRRGILPAESDGAAYCFADEPGLQIALHPTAAGTLPIVVASARADFEYLIRALSHRNEPVSIPASMGACI